MCRDEFNSYMYYIYNIARAHETWPKAPGLRLSSFINNTVRRPSTWQKISAPASLHKKTGDWEQVRKQLQQTYGIGKGSHLNLIKELAILKRSGWALGTTAALSQIRRQDTKSH